MSHSILITAPSNLLVKAIPLPTNINVASNHPRSILKQIPNAVNKSLLIVY